MEGIIAVKCVMGLEVDQTKENDCNMGMKLHVNTFMQYVLEHGSREFCQKTEWMH